MLNILKGFCHTFLDSFTIDLINSIVFYIKLGDKMSSKFTMYLNSKTSKMDNLDIY